MPNENEPTAPSETKKSGGRFVKGQSGNLKGRPKGKSLITQMRDAMGNRLAKDALEILEKVIQQAKDGNEASQKMLLDRLWPAERPSERGSGKHATPIVNITVARAEAPVHSVVLEADERRD